MIPPVYSPPPTVGILVSVTQSQNGFPIGSETKFLKEKFSMAKEYGINLFVFFPDGVNWANQTIIGFLFITTSGKKGYWVRRTFPFPDIVYNRIRQRNIEIQPRVKNLLKRFNDESNIILLNRRFFDKWEVYKVLLDDPSTSEMVPRTRLLSAANLKHYLSRRSMVYIKPRRNNAARGIIKIVRVPEGYTYCQALSTAPQWEKRANFISLWKQLRFFIKNPNNYVVQMGIDLYRMDGRILDFRAQVQKNGNGDWVFTGMEARLAQKGRIATTGLVYGTRKSPQKMINMISQGSEDFKRMINRQLSYLYLAVPPVLEKKLGFALAVLSIDIGIDTNGRVWIIEVSSKPEPFVARSIRARHCKNLIEYFLYLSPNTK